MKKILLSLALLLNVGVANATGYPWSFGQQLNSADLNAAFANRTTYSTGLLTPNSILLGNGNGDIKSFLFWGVAGQALISNGPGLAPYWGVSGVLPLASVTQLYGGTGTAGVSQPITLGTNLSMTGTTLNASGGGGSGMTYPSSGVPNSTGSAWGTSYSVSGTGNVALTTNPVFTTPNLGTPSTAILTNAAGTASALTAGHVTTNANLTGDVTSTGNATTLATVNSSSGSIGSGTAIPVITTNAKGLVTTQSTIALAKATTSALGVVQPDGTTIAVNGSGVISSIGGAATSVVSGTTTVGGTCTSGYELYNNAGVIGCRAISTATPGSYTATNITIGSDGRITAAANGAGACTAAGANCVGWFNVLSYGADRTGATSSQTAIASAISAANSYGGGTVYLPAGLYEVTAALAISGNNVVLRGDGPNSTTIFTTCTTCDILDLSGYGDSVIDIGFGVPGASYTNYTFNSVTYLVGPQTAGAFLNMTGNNQTISNVSLGGAYVGVQITGNDIRVNHISMGNFSASGYGINSASGNAPVWIESAQIIGQGKPSAGINVASGGDLHIMDSEIISMGTQLSIQPGAGNSVASVWANHTFFDNGPGFASQNGIIINTPTSTSNVSRLHFIGCWTSSQTGQGFLIENTGGGVVTGIEIIGNESYGNSGNGLQIGSGAVGVEVVGGTFSGNAGDGISISANASSFSITGIQAGASGWVSGNTGYGVHVYSGSSNNYLISDNNLVGNSSGALLDGGSGATKFVVNNVGMAASATVAGPSSSVQYNGSGSPAGSANLEFDGNNLTDAGMIRSTADAAVPGSGTGAEVYYDSTSGAIFQGYNRSTSAYQTTTLAGSTVILKSGGNNAISAASSGVATFAYRPVFNGYTPYDSGNLSFGTGLTFSGGTLSVSSGGSMVYPSSPGIANFNGTGWGTSYTVGTSATNLVQLNGSAQLPAVNGSLLTNITLTAAPTLSGTLIDNGGSATAIEGSGTGTLPVLTVSNSTSGTGAMIGLYGDGSNPNKYIRSTGGSFQILNSAGSGGIMTLTDAGSFATPAGVFFAGLPSSSSAATGSVCWTNSDGHLSVDTTTACLSSTIRVKENIKPLKDGLSTVMQFNPVSYDLKPEFNPEHLGRQVGLIAEDVQTIDDRLVGLRPDGTVAGVRYMQLTAVLVKAIQEQQKEIGELKAKVDYQQHEIDEIKAALKPHQYSDITTAPAANDTQFFNDAILYLKAAK